VVVHSCGYVEPLIDGLIRAGMDCLQAMEVKAGMDLVHLAERFGHKISFCGGFDIRTLESNNIPLIDTELNRVVRRVVDMGCGYILHTDHSIPPGVDYDTLVHFFQHGSKIVRTPGA
jgi:uroporphyrinogen decarboxylase